MFEYNALFKHIKDFILNGSPNKLQFKRTNIQMNNLNYTSKSSSFNLFLLPITIFQGSQLTLI